MGKTNSTPTEPAKLVYESAGQFLKIGAMHNKPEVQAAITEALPELCEKVQSLLADPQTMTGTEFGDLAQVRQCSTQTLKNGQVVRMEVRLVTQPRQEELPTRRTC